MHPVLKKWKLEFMTLIPEHRFALHETLEMPSGAAGLSIHTYSRGSCRIALALVRPFGHVPHLIHAILRYFPISYFSTDLLMSFSYSSSNLSVLMRRVQWNLVVDPLHGIPVSYCLSYGPLILFSKVSSASLISQSGSFALPAVMGCTGIALLSRSTLTHGPQWTPIPGPRLEEPPSGQSQNQLK